MSSIQEKKLKINRSGFLLRSPSLQKIKCSANQLQVSISGSILSKECSVIHHLKSLMNLSRSSVQNISVPLIHIISVAMVFLMNLITKDSGRFPECLEKFIIKINQWKSKHQLSEPEIKITNLTAERFSQILLHIASQLCIFFVCFQLALLSYFIGLTKLKFGFLFLICCISLVQVLILKISFMKKQVRCSRRQLHNKILRKNQVEIKKTKEIIKKAL